MPSVHNFLNPRGSADICKVFVLHAFSTLLVCFGNDLATLDTIMSRCHYASLSKSLLLRFPYDTCLEATLSLCFVNTAVAALLRPTLAHYFALSGRFLYNPTGELLMRHLERVHTGKCKSTGAGCNELVQSKLRTGVRLKWRKK